VLFKWSIGRASTIFITVLFKTLWCKRLFTVVKLEAIYINITLTMLNYSIKGSSMGTSWGK